MKIFAKIAFVITLSLSAIAVTGLKAGSEFKNHNVQGNIRVTCFTGSQTRHASFRCSDSYLSPAMFSKFTHEENLNADRVKLTYTDSRGKRKSKSSKYSSKKRESRESFNLWIWTLLQRPMLKEGLNVIDYELTKKGKSVASGSFEVNVEALETRYCPYASYTSSFESDCTTGTTICDRYFRDYNYCQ